MFGAIYIGLSGLNAYSRGLQAVSNNVSNLNTAGFKGTTVSFQNFYGSGSDAGLSYLGSHSSGGHGVGVGPSTIDFSQGELRQTDNDLDLAVDGKGFLTLLDGERTFYVRTGSFNVDPDGYVVLTGTNYRLATLDKEGKPVSLSLQNRQEHPPKATTKIEFSGNVSTTPQTGNPIPDSLPTVTVNSLTVYDSVGTKHVWTVKLERVTPGIGDPTVTSQWQVSVLEGSRPITNAADLPKIRYMMGGTADGGNKVTVTDANNHLSVTLDFSGTIAADQPSSLASTSIDGYPMGDMPTIAVTEAGHLQLSYSNNQKSDLGAIALADFRDLQSLEERDGGLFVQKDGSARQFLAGEDSRVGRVMSKRIEASNVDLSQEFGSMIMIQRGFQASSQIVSVSNDMIQQLFGIRGQG